MTQDTHTEARTPMEELERRRASALAMGGEERIARHHASGRLTARERIALLIDDGSWTEIGLHALPEHRREEPSPGDAIVTGFGRVGGRMVGIVAIDATVLAGTTAPVNMRKQNRVAEWAGKRGLPLIFLSDNDGGRLPDLLGWRFAGVPFDFSSFLQSPAGHPKTPRMTAVVGPSFGDAALHAAIADLVVMKRDASLALSGPPVIKGAIGEDVSAEELGGPAVAHETSGSAHVVVDAEEEAIATVKRFLSYMPDAADLPAPVAPPAPPARDPEDLLTLVPANPRRGYDMNKVLQAIVDEGSLFAWGDRFGRSLITALARIDGHPVGIVASQPMQRAGVLDVPALTKEQRFVELCDTFNIPLAFLQDVPGLMIGTEAERGGILACYERLAAALAQTTVPKVAVIVRKAFGGGHIAMGGRPVNPDMLVAWPGAEMGFMAPETGVRTVYRRRLDALEAEEGLEARDALAAELEAEWAAESQPWEAAANIILDDVIDPRQTRAVIAQAITLAWGSRERVSRRGLS
ncbi:MAG TPA: carboxyl transferase domain-containing protein [Baekduia sp.]|uniref:acyl-CoA carboxylase subunit beta n=1 Tax=Baekduia sp. TaxID=2600305 RepID=UPI002D772210|nr:carboxyl transferase domain-containing protein [Baekduia sp.]HET6507018.1 carboxyl transferase domain-containing protein [Baekduia sp.]